MGKSIVELIEESKTLEEIAGKIQVGEQVGLSDEEINSLVERYQSWFAECLALLPEDLRERFRSEYKGMGWSALLFKIKDFLAAPTKPNTLRATSEKNASIFPYWQHPYETSFRAPLLAQRQILLEASKRLVVSQNAPGPVEIIEFLVRRFHAFSQQLQSRHNRRQTLRIKDEYDVQDLFHAMLKLFFNDIRPEEATPSYAGGSSRMDFVLKAEQIVVELKMTRDGLDDKELGRQLKLDIADYRSHPDCKTLIVFVYDQKGFIHNPKGIENDLNRVIDNLLVKVIIIQS